MVHDATVTLFNPLVLCWVAYNDDDVHDDANSRS